MSMKFRRGSQESGSPRGHRSSGRSPLQKRRDEEGATPATGRSPLGLVGQPAARGEFQKGGRTNTHDFRYLLSGAVVSSATPISLLFESSFKPKPTKATSSN